MVNPARKPELQIVQTAATPATLDYYIGIFLEAKAGKAPKTVRGYTCALALFRAYVGPRAWPITPEHINSYLADCRDRQLKVATIDSYFGIIRGWLGWLTQRGKLTENPIKLAEKPPHPKSLPRAPAAQQLQEFFKRLEAVANKGKGHWLDVRGLAFWSLVLDTGLRIGEVTALKVTDVTIEKGRRFAFISGGKTNSDRVVYFDKKAGKDVKRWLKVRAGLPLPAKLSALFVSYVRGEWGGLTSWGARQALTRRCDEWGLTHITPHQFRNAHAVYWLWDSGNLLDLQKQLGHTNLTTTARYTKVEDMGRGKRHRKHSPRGKL